MQPDGRSITRDNNFYWVDVVFLVEDRLFRVPRTPFERSSVVFRDMFQLPVPSDGAEGVSDEQPLHLDGIKKKDFCLLLNAMFQSCPGSQRLETMSWRELFLVVELSAMWQMDELRDLAIEKIILLPMDTSEWVAALKLSTLQFVTKIRDTAIDHLTPTDCLPLMDKISLAVESRVADWLLSCLKEIVVRNETISLEEQEQLGVDMTLRLFRIRDRCHRNLYGASYPDADVALRTEFEGELNASEYTHGSYMSLKPASRPENRKGRKGFL